MKIETAHIKFLRVSTCRLQVNKTALMGLLTCVVHDAFVHSEGLFTTHV